MPLRWEWRSAVWNPSENVAPQKVQSHGRHGMEGLGKTGTMQAGGEVGQGWVEGEEQGWRHWGPTGHLLPASTARLRVGGAEAALSWKRNEWE